MRILQEEDVYNACIGGGVLACGGGGWYEHGIKNGLKAVQSGTVTLISVDELQPTDIVVTVSAIGAPAAKDWEMHPQDYLRAIKLLEEALEAPIKAVMTAQNGYSTSINGWLQSSLLHIPVVDAAGDLRAHPTIKLGSLGLATDPAYQTIQAVAGGNRKQGKYLEAVLRGAVIPTSNALRAISVESGGFIAAARNPLPAQFIKERAAKGALSFALSLGKTMRAEEKSGAEAVIQAVASHLQGTVLGKGKITEFSLLTQGGFDHARYTIETAQGIITVVTLNEHMKVALNGKVVAFYPDIITLLTTQNGFPLATYTTEIGQEVAVVVAKAENLPKAYGVDDSEVLLEVEKIIESTENFFQ